MFGFFSDIKDRLSALETKVEAVWQHLFESAAEVPHEVVNEVHASEDVVDPNAGNVETASVQQEPSTMDVTKPIESGTEGTTDAT